MSLCVTITTPSGIVVAGDSRLTRNLKKLSASCYNDDGNKATVFNDVIISHVGNGYIYDHSDITTDVFLNAVKEKYKNKTISIHRWPELIIKEFENAIEKDSYRKYQKDEIPKITEDRAIFFTIAGYSTRKNEADIPFLYTIDTYKKSAKQIGVYKILVDGGCPELRNYLNKTGVNAALLSLDQAIQYARLVIESSIAMNRFVNYAKQAIGGECRIYAIDRILGIAGAVDENNKILPDPMVKVGRRKIV